MRSKEKKRGGGGKGTWGKPGSELEVLSEEVEKVQDQQPSNGAADAAAAENDAEVEPEVRFQRGTRVECYFVAVWECLVSNRWVLY